MNQITELVESSCLYSCNICPNVVIIMLNDRSDYKIADDNSAGARELEPPSSKYKCETPIITGVWGRSRGRALGQGGQDSEAPMKLKLLAFGRPLNAANLPTFKKIGNAKSYTICVVFAKNKV